MEAEYKAICKIEYSKDMGIFQVKAAHNKKETIQTLSLYPKILFVIIGNIIMKRKGRSIEVIWILRRIGVGKKTMLGEMFLIASTIWTVGWGLFLTFYQCLFLKEMLGVKYRYTYLWFYLGSWLYGHINVRFGVAGTSWGNMVYLCGCAFALNTVLFHGSIIKRGFFTLWLYGIQEVAGGIFYLVFMSLASLTGQEKHIDIISNSVDLAVGLTLFFMMGILKRKLHLLKRDFEDRDGVYLMCIIIFICIAVSMICMSFDTTRNWDVEYMYAVLVPCGLIAVGGEVLNVYCIIMLEQRLVERLTKQQYQILGRHLEISKEQYEQFIKLRHDMKNHSLCLAQLLKKENIEEARRYLEQWNNTLEEGEVIVRTGSVFADALLNPKYHQAKKLGIDISIQMSLPGEKQIAPVDLCCLLANALDNAIEACQRGMEAGHPAGWIRMKSQIYPNYWIFEISNSTYVSVKQHEGRFPSSKQTPISGVGLQNIRKVVERYEGVLDLKNGTSFTLIAMFPLP